MRGKDEQKKENDVNKLKITIRYEGGGGTPYDPAENGGPWTEGIAHSCPFYC